MKVFNHRLVVVLWSLFVVAACQTKEANSNQVESTNQTNTVMEDPPTAPAEAQLRHVVIFKFKEGTDQAAITKVEEAFAGLSSKIPEIKDFEWGLNNSPEGLDKGFTHCFFVTFGSEEDREVYLPHPDHQEFVKLLDGILDDVMVIDYWAK